MAIGSYFKRLVGVGAGLALAIPVMLAQPAAAAVDPSAPVWYEVDVISVSKNSNVVRYDMELGRGGGTAKQYTISASRKATRTIGTAYGISFAGVAAQLGISSSTTQTITSTCTGTPRLPTYPWVVGYAHGTTYTYKVRQRTYEYGRLVKTVTSTKTAFNPTGIRCALAS